MAYHRSVSEAQQRSLIAVGFILAGAIATGGEERRLGLIPGVSRLAATANGQTVRCLDGERGAIVSFEADRPAEWRDVVGPLVEFRCAAIGCLPGDLVVAVGQDADAWWLRSYRIEPGMTADSAAPLQTIALGEADATERPVAIVASSARGWLAIVGLPPPLPPVLRAAVAGVRIGPCSERSCPELPAGIRPLAATVSPRDELVLVLPVEPAVGDPSRGDTVVYYDLTGRERARFDSGVTAVRGIAFDRRGDTLCMVGQRTSDGQTGLWRLDAVLRGGRQSIRTTLVAAAVAPRDLAAAADRMLIMLTSDLSGTLVLVDPSPPVPVPPPIPGDASP